MLFHAQWGPCALRHCIQTSMEAILACYVVLSQNDLTRWQNGVDDDVCTQAPLRMYFLCLFVVHWRTPRGSWRSMAGLKQHSALLTLSSLISSHSHLHMYSYPAICKHTLILVLEWMKILDSLVFGCPYEQAYMASKCNAEHSFCPSSGSCQFRFVSSVCVTLSVLLYLVIYLETFSPFLW